MIYSLTTDRQPVIYWATNHLFARLYFHSISIIGTKSRKEDHCVIIYDRVMVLALCTSSDDLLSMYQVLVPFCTFRNMLRTSFFIAKIKKEV